MDGWLMISTSTPQSEVVMPPAPPSPARFESGDRRVSTDNPRLLIADDRLVVSEALSLQLKGEGYRIESVGSPAAIMESIETDDFDAVLMDLNYTRDTTSGGEGLDLLTHIRSHDATLPVVVMTAWGSVDVA